MGYSGQFVHSWKDANIGAVVEIHCNADYPHFSFRVEKVQDGHVTLKDGGEQLTLPIKSRKKPGNPRFDIPPYVQEYVEISQMSAYERIYKLPPTKFDVLPFKGERF